MERRSDAARESSAPVGSSARISLGSVISALATAALCFCPPEPRREIFQKLVNVKGFCNGADLLFHLLIIFACQHKGKIDVIPETECVQKVKILEYEA